MNNRSKGFTLIELLLGLSIFSVIGVLVYSTFAGGIKLSVRAQKDNQFSREVYWTYEQITKDLERATAYDFSNSYPDLSSFVGTENSIGFVIAAPEGLKFVSYELMPPEKTHVHQVIITAVRKKNVSQKIISGQSLRRNYLVRTEIDFLDYLNGTKKDSDQEVLAMNVQQGGFKVNYAYQAIEGGESVVFKNEWDSQGFPVNVGIGLTFLDDQNVATEFYKQMFNPAGSHGGEE